MYVDSISNQDIDRIDEFDKKIVCWNGRSITELSNMDVYPSNQDSTLIAIKGFREMMASCSVRRKKGDEEVEIRIEVDTRKPKPETKPDPKPPEKPN